MFRWSRWNVFSSTFSVKIPSLENVYFPASLTSFPPNRYTLLNAYDICCHGYNNRVSSSACMHSYPVQLSRVSSNKLWVLQILCTEEMSVVGQLRIVLQLLVRPYAVETCTMVLQPLRVSGVFVSLMWRSMKGPSGLFLGLRYLFSLFVLLVGSLNVRGGWGPTEILVLLLTTGMVLIWFAM